MYIYQSVVLITVSDTTICYTKTWHIWQEITFTLLSVGDFILTPQYNDLFLSLQINLLLFSIISDSSSKSFFLWFGPRGDINAPNIIIYIFELCSTVPKFCLAKLSLIHMLAIFSDSRYQPIPKSGNQLIFSRDL